jgi:hypothetical protein
MTQHLQSTNLDRLSRGAYLMCVTKAYTYSGLSHEVHGPRPDSQIPLIDLGDLVHASMRRFGYHDSDDFYFADWQWLCVFTREFLGNDKSEFGALPFRECDDSVIPGEYTGLKRPHLREVALRNPHLLEDVVGLQYPGIDERTESSVDRDRMGTHSETKLEDTCDTANEIEDLGPYAVYNERESHVKPHNKWPFAEDYPGGIFPADLSACYNVPRAGEVEEAAEQLHEEVEQQTEPLVKREDIRSLAKEYVGSIFPADLSVCL